MPPPPNRQSWGVGMDVPPPIHWTSDEKRNLRAVYTVLGLAPVGKVPDIVKWSLVAEHMSTRARENAGWDVGRKYGWENCWEAAKLIQMEQIEFRGSKM